MKHRCIEGDCSRDVYRNSGYCKEHLTANRNIKALRAPKKELHERYHVTSVSNFKSSTDIISELIENANIPIMEVKHLNVNDFKDRADGRLSKFTKAKIMARKYAHRSTILRNMSRQKITTMKQVNYINAIISEIKTRDFNRATEMETQYE